MKKLCTLYCTRKPKAEENMEVGIIGLEDGKRKEVEESVETNEWWVIIRLQVTIHVI